MKHCYTLLVFILLFSLSSCLQTTKKKTVDRPNTRDSKVGGGCEGCEAIYESPVSFDELNEVDT